jgi:hypothetical protein
MSQCIFDVHVRVNRFDATSKRGREDEDFAAVIHCGNISSVDSLSKPRRGPYNALGEVLATHLANA